jgi:D-arabinose 1-dehydrogenase-like Zn-dependent alcohol dehydrogenase
MNENNHSARDLKFVHEPGVVRTFEVSQLGALDSQDTLKFSALTGVHPMIEKYPLSRVAEAYEQMHSGKVWFRVVLTLGG